MLSCSSKVCSFSTFFSCSADTQWLWRASLCYCLSRHRLHPTTAMSNPIVKQQVSHRKYCQDPTPNLKFATWALATVRPDAPQHAPFLTASRTDVLSSFRSPKYRPQVKAAECHRCQEHRIPSRCFSRVRGSLLAEVAAGLLSLYNGMNSSTLL